MANSDRNPVTIYDVAKHAGVSPMTVSRVVNKNTNVSEAMRTRVLASLKALDYSVNFAAQSTRAGITKIKLGILYSELSAHYLNEVLVGSLEQTSRLGCQLILERFDDDQSERQAISQLIKQGVDGIILPPPLCDSEALIRLLQNENIQVLSLASATPLEDVSAVRIDDFEASVAMTRYLIKLGHRRIAFVKGHPRHTSSLVRFYGYSTALQNAGITIDEALVAPGLYTYQSGVEAAQYLLRRMERPTAIFASNDDMAAGVLGVAHGMQLRIPEDLSVVGFDDTLIATATWPTITTIHQPIGAMGRAAVSTLVDRIRDKRSAKASRPEHELMKFTLMERGSTGPAPEDSAFSIGILRR